MLFLSQIKQGGVVCREGQEARLVKQALSVYELAQEAIKHNVTLASVIKQHGLGEQVDLVELGQSNQLDCPVRHPDPAHMYLTGTGLTHLGSASTRNAMHAKSEELTDSMKIFQMGVEGGKPIEGQEGVQPEWFYKGNGAGVMAPGEAILSPSFALDGGEEPEIAGFYLIGEDGKVHRLGYTLANEFSDHVTERQNYLYLAHSKLRPAAFGPELLVGELPRHIEGHSRIERGETTLWEKGFVSGEDNMSHTFKNLEHHHFKYAIFRQPGDLHVHMFGTATLSFADGVQAREGDVFEIVSPTFGLPLRNTFSEAAPLSTEVSAL
ncbi:AraD1 family protein [Marinomonas posidonica]|uniref:Fumarylacetoacetate (FAA) hydrolase n=1 Tax=Marinomonas posidonica (strain CECT 7376 / NCIMB 14433 / IVIA-Po-181) TaxID=491952 RepID=F6CT64_MARPP|nr:AraD1 family protein [Marinomonas posidonica]AEF56230.1 fumarylacetoacetate (FAA) hydrolase [Marinomonas posidonica IVIA-Po-181]